ncbi:unnamed protein product [Arabidopsis thaliana]|uniref:(thale cress) hypothetical protein n=1 Tax=Arabidopsis thaliana TaxID=3702 RepID=A0A7G2EA24_ARATH|nr:unnamed protein product [Arabidopsis thaliana]
MAVMEQVFVIPAPEDTRTEGTVHVQADLTLFTFIERARRHVATPGADDVSRFLIVLVQTKFQRMIRMEIVRDVLRQMRASFTKIEIARATCQLDKFVFVANAANPVCYNLRRSQWAFMGEMLELCHQVNERNRR